MTCSSYCDKIVTDHKFMSAGINLRRTERHQVVGVPEFKLRIYTELKYKPIGVSKPVCSAYPYPIVH